MKKAIHYCICLAFGISSFSVLPQEQDLSIGFQLNPSVSSAQFSGGAQFTLNGGIEVQERVSDHFSVESGIHLFNRGFTARNLLLSDESGNMNEFVVQFNRKMICIPVTFVFNVHRFYVGAGANINYVFFNQIVTTQGGNVQGQSDLVVDGRSLLGAQCMVGYSFGLTPRLSLDLETYLNTTFEGLNLYNYGIGTGLKYDF